MVGVLHGAVTGLGAVKACVSWQPGLFVDGAGCCLLGKVRSWGLVHMLTALAPSCCCCANLCLCSK